MLILTLRTDKPESEIGLYLDGDRIAYVSWAAHRQLAETLHRRIEDMLAANNRQLKDIQALCVYKGPGSFTGLRIGLSVANSLAASYKVPIVGETGASWIEQGIERIVASDNDLIALPEYGAPATITQPRK